MTVIQKRKRVLITMDTNIYKALKKLAIDNDLRLSDLLVAAGTAMPIQTIKEHLKTDVLMDK